MAPRNAMSIFLTHLLVFVGGEKEETGFFLTDPLGLLVFGAFLLILSGGETGNHYTKINNDWKFSPKGFGWETIPLGSLL